ncbi:retrovirus-related pol polyprotein from transposon TNT 1-94 [Tanacetum coccineum]
MVPKAVLMRSVLVSVNTARQVNTAHTKTIVNDASPMSNISKTTHSTVKMTINKNIAFKNSNQKVNTVRGNNVKPVRPKPVVMLLREIMSMLLRPQLIGIQVSDSLGLQKRLLFLPYVQGNPQQDLQEKGVINSRCSRHMTGNMSYLTEFEEINGGYVAFRGNPKGGEITGRVPRKNKMYSVDLKNIVPKGGLTCLISKATSDESKLWHRRLGHINFKTMNNLVKGNLVRDERKNRTLIKAARIMLANSKLPTTFWAKAVNTACYVQNRVLVTKPHNKTPYELFLGRKPTLGFMRPFRCPVTILNTIDHLDKFNGKDDEEFFVGYSINSKAFRVFNSRTRIVKENLHVQFSEDTPNIAGSGPNWLFGIDALTNTSNVNAASTNEVNAVGGKTNIKLPDDLNMPALEDIVYSDDDEDDGAEADMNNLDITIQVFRNKKDEKGIVIKNKARLVTQRYIQEEGIDYDEVFALVAKIEAIILFLAYASFKDFVVYQIDVKSVFLYGNIEEEVYVCQLLGFEDPYFLARVYKVEKALYGLHQAPRAWYETLSTYLLDNGFQKGKIDKTLFIRRDKGNILLVQVYVDDIISGFTKKSLCNAFEKLMHEKFQMSSMGELTFFLGLQVKQKNDGILISQDKYVAEILKKFRFIEVKTASTPTETQKPSLEYEDGEEVDVHLYRLMIGSLMYLTSSRPDIMFTMYACARYKVNPKVSHLYVVQMIFSDYAEASLDRKSTTGGCQFLRSRLISWQCKKQTMVANSTTEAEYVVASSFYGQAKTINGKVQLQALVDEKKIIITESTVRRDLQLEDAEGVDCLPNATIFEELTLMGVPKNNTEVPQPSGSTKNVVDQAVYKELDDSLVRAATTASSLEVDLKLRVKKLEKKGGSRTYKLKRLYKVGRFARIISSDEASLGDQEDASKQGRKINDIDKDAKIILVDKTQARYDDDLMFDTSDLAGEEILVVEQGVLDSKKDDVVSTASVAITVSATTKTVLITPKEITLAQALKELKTSKPKVKGIVFKEPVESTTAIIISSQQPSQVKVQNKDKGKMVEPEKPMKKKELIRLDEEIASKLQAEFDKEKLFDKAMKRVNTFVDMDTELVESSEESTKKQKVNDDKEIAELKRLMEVMPDKEEVALDAIPLAIKSPSIVDWKIHKERKKSYY